MSTILLEPLVTKGAREKERAKTEVGVVMPTEGVTVIIKGVVTMRQRTRVLLGMATRVAKGAKVTVVNKGDKATVVKEARVTTNHPPAFATL